MPSTFPRGRFVWNELLTSDPDAAAGFYAKAPGRFAVLGDPQGAAFSVFTPAPSESAGTDEPGIGGFSWHELAAADWKAAARARSKRQAKPQRTKRPRARRRRTR